MTTKPPTQPQLTLDRLPDPPHEGEWLRAIDGKYGELRMITKPPIVHKFQLVTIRNKNETAIIARGDKVAVYQLHCRAQGVSLGRASALLVLDLAMSELEQDHSGHGQ